MSLSPYWGGYAGIVKGELFALGDELVVFLLVFCLNKGMVSEALTFGSGGHKYCKDLIGIALGQCIKGDGGMLSQ